MTEGIARRAMAEDLQEDATAPVELARIDADIAPSLNYASWQNSVPLVRSLEVVNTSGEVLSGLELRLATSPPFARAKVWRIEQLGPGQSLAVRDRDVEFDADYLAGLDEAERGVVRFTLHRREELLAEVAYPTRVLARDEWGGMPTAELLAAHVMPNDPAVARLLKTASEVLTRHGHPPGLDGYQSGDPRRAYLLSAALWSAVAGERITYAAPPSSFEQTGQKTRRPGVVLGDKLATCLDTTLLFAAGIEALGLNAVIVMQQGHCFVGAWIVEKTLPKIIETDPTELRKAIAGRELYVWETTLVTNQPPATFKDAIARAAESLRDTNDGQFVAAIDVARARMAQIRPLASHVRTSEATPTEVAGPLPLPQAPQFGTLGAEESEEKPSTAEGRIQRWQRKLLDLSLRNKLLNFRPTKQTVPVLCPDLAHLENRLAAGTKLRLVSLESQNPIGQRDRQLHQQRSGKDLDVEFARQALERDEVPCEVSENDLTGRLTTLYRAVRNDLAEGGSNTLYLAVGFLKWKPRDDASKAYRAPLLLIPATLTRRSAASPFYLQHHEDDVRFNATLIQMLKKDFDCDISAMESNLPEDESGVDVPVVFERMRRAVRDIPGFEVVDECALATFSFAKYLMWKDLVERLDDLKNNRVVRHLIEDPDKPFEPAARERIPSPQEIDKRFEPQSILHPLPADSSQLAAVMAAAEGQDFVLIGPPGTGKSQTIANLIAQCLGMGKTVLFVAEKTAALDVVYRRLREHGLGDCCLELHSNRADRRKFLDQLNDAWQNNRRVQESEWITVNGRLKLRRDELNSYAEAIHQQHPNGWTVFEAMGCVVRGAGREVSKFNWPTDTSHDRATTQQCEDLVRRAATTFKAIDPTVRLPQVAATEWSASWESQLLESCEQLRLAAGDFKRSFGCFTAALGLPDKTDGSWGECENLSQLAEALGSCAGEQAKVIFHKQFAQFTPAADQLAQTIALYSEVVQQAEGQYSDDGLEKIPLDDLDQRWRLACASFWPMSWLAKRKVTRLLQSYAAGGKANPMTDLPALQARCQHLAAIAGSPLAGEVPYFKGLNTDMGALRSYLERTNRLRKAILAVGQPLQRTNDISRTVFSQWTGAQRDLPVFAAARDYLQAWEEFRGGWPDSANLPRPTQWRRRIRR